MQQADLGHEQVAGGLMGSTDVDHGLGKMDLVPLLAMGDLAPPDVEADRVRSILAGLPQVAVRVVRGAEAASLTFVGAEGSPAGPQSSGIWSPRRTVIA